MLCTSGVSGDRDQDAPRFRGAHGGVDRLRVAHLANEDHVGILAERGAKSQSQALGVHADLALRDGRLNVAVQKLDGILERHHVLALRDIDVVDHRGRGARLARTRQARDEHHAALGVRDALQHRRKPERLEARDLEGNQPHHDHEARALAQDVHPETADALRTPGTVVIQDVVDLRPVLFVRDELHRDRTGLLRGQRLLRERHERAIDACAKHVARLDVQVARASVNRRLDDLLHISIRPACLRGCAAGRPLGTAQSYRGRARSTGPRTGAAKPPPHEASAAPEEGATTDYRTPAVRVKRRRAPRPAAGRLRRPRRGPARRPADPARRCTRSRHAAATRGARP